MRGEGSRKPGRLVGILTNRDVRFASDPAQKIYELMTRENLITVREKTSSTKKPSASYISTASKNCWS